MIEACDTLDEATTNESRRAASQTRAREFACMGDRRAVFRSQQEWRRLLEPAGSSWRVTRVGAVRELADANAARALAPPDAMEHQLFFVAQKREPR